MRMFRPLMAARLCYHAKSNRTRRCSALALSGAKHRHETQEISYLPAGDLPIDIDDSLCDDGSMTYPRSHLVSEEEPGFYHVVSRCVRRAFLCGQDRVTGRCFEHRRAWIEDRILELADAFAVSVFSYSVMSNHFHVVLHVDPTVPASWSDEEVARRWLAAFPGGIGDMQSAGQSRW